MDDVSLMNMMVDPIVTVSLVIRVNSVWKKSELMTFVSRRLMRSANKTNKRMTPSQGFVKGNQETASSFFSFPCGTTYQLDA